MRKSCQGSIRRAPSSISWVFSLVNLSVYGHHDSGALIKAWTLGGKTIFGLVGSFSK